MFKKVIPFFGLLMGLVLSLAAGAVPAHASAAVDTVPVAQFAPNGGDLIAVSGVFSMPTPAAPLMSTAQAEQVFTDGFVVVGWLIAAILLPLAFLVGKRLTSWVLSTFKRNLR